jgi:anti-sigma regulatory factor (Ser/Thr protein kinase)
MMQGHAEEVFPSQRLRAGARPCSPLRNETGRPGRPPHQADGGAFRWLLPAAEMAGLAGGSRRSSPDPAPAARPYLPRVATRTIGADAGSVRAARDFTVATLRRWGTPERGNDIAIVVSELLTNALQHAMPRPGGPWPPRPIRLGLLQHGSATVLCAVADPGSAVPVPRTPGSFAETGRGLQMICALSDRWGYTPPSEVGKIVWAMFDPRPYGRAR